MRMRWAGAAAAALGAPGSASPERSLLWGCPQLASSRQKPSPAAGPRCPLVQVFLALPSPLSIAPCWGLRVPPAAARRWQLPVTGAADGCHGWEQTAADLIITVSSANLWERCGNTHSPCHALMAFGAVLRQEQWRSGVVRR